VSLDDIPAGSRCVVDTNVLLYAEHAASAQAQRFIRRSAGGEISAILPQTVWQELAHKLMLAEAQSRGLISGSNPAAKLAAKPEAVRSLTLYRVKVKSLRDLGFGYEACLLSDLTERGFALQQKYGLLINDAVVLAVALRLKVDCLVSSDKAFRGVREMALYYPSDLKH